MWDVIYNTIVTILEVMCPYKKSLIREGENIGLLMKYNVLYGRGLNL